ncbi:histidine phosphatase family protein [Synechococcus sp. MIT S1220]|uniref:histidine phosphatase family protein n=1 Tax=Synechococcus sp. MIT S1220 TaxID=3082549 RepID=UPI0039AF7739
MPLRLLLVRHGLSSFNQERRIQGRDDLSGLTDEGHEQARRLGASLAEVPLSAVYTSPLQRAASTTASLLEGRGAPAPEPIFDDGLLEVDLEPWSGLRLSELTERHPEAYGVWKRQPLELQLNHSDGSTYKPLAELMDQARGTIDALLKRHPVDGDDTVLVVAHNAILRCLMLVLLNEPDNGFRRLRVDNTSLSIFNLRPGEDRPQVQIECLNNTTHLAPLPPKGAAARLILVRHGETDWNKEGRFQGQIDIPLNDHGRSQASAARDFLQDIQIDRAWSSTMSRPSETASIILERHPSVTLIKTDGLVEIGHGLWEGKLESEINAGWSDLLARWKRAPETVQMPEGETIQDVWARSVRTWQEIASTLKPDETALVVAHDAVNKTILCDLLGLTPADIWAVKQGNGGVTVVDIAGDPGQPAVVTCLNLTSHFGSVIDRTAAGAL